MGWSSRASIHRMFWGVLAGIFIIAGGIEAAFSNDGQLKRQGAVSESQPQGKPDPDLLPLWAALVGKATGPVSVTWSHLWRTPKAVYGVLSQPMEASEASARQFLSSQAALLKLDASLSGLTLASERTTPMGRVYGFTQRAHGVPVYGSELKVHLIALAASLG